MVAGLESLRVALAPYPAAYTVLVLAALVVAAWLANLVTKKVLLRALQSVLARFSGSDQQAVGLRVIPRLANVVPALVLQTGLVLVPGLPPKLVAGVQALCEAFIVLTIALAVARALQVVNDAWERRADARNRPIKGYLQVATIVVYVLAGLTLVAILSGVKVTHVLTGLGAASAVLMLIFQDTILSFAASLQISNDGRVRVGDWIEMPSQNADGDVIDIALHTVTVQNWDKTVTTIPTKKLISDSFKNWRGMQESGGRRIKRALLIDQGSVRFLEPHERDRLRRIALIDGYLEDKRHELEAFNRTLLEAGKDPVNTRRVTNIGTFRAYVSHYLRAHPGVNQGMTQMVRQLAPGSTGLPLEIYCFTSTVAWVGYEGIQADIFDHLIAMLPEFGLRLYQAPGGADVSRGLEGLAGTASAASAGATVVGAPPPPPSQPQPRGAATAP